MTVMPDDAIDPAQPTPHAATPPASSPQPAPHSPPADPTLAASLSESENGTATVERVPLFPLLNVVLFPGAVLPLHIFENRYRAMTADALGLNLGLNAAKHADGRKLVCMCRIKPGHDPMDDQPPLFDVACVGRITHHEALPDGRCNLLLQGLRRVRLGREYPLGEAGHDRRPYRRADLHPLRCGKAFEIDVADARGRMTSLCSRPPILGTPVAKHLEKLIHSNATTVALADVIAFDLIECPDDRQRLLEQTDERRRVEQLIDLLARQFPDPASILPHGHRFDVDEA